MSKGRKIKSVQSVFIIFYALKGLKCTLASVEQSALPRRQGINTVTSHFHKML